MNNHGQYNRRAFAEFTEVYRIEYDFKAKVEAEFDPDDRGGSRR